MPEVRGRTLRLTATEYGLYTVTVVGPDHRILASATHEIYVR